MSEEKEDRHKIRHNKERLIKAMQESFGNVTLACKKSRIDRSTYYRYFKADQEFAKSCTECEEIALDHVESQLMKQIEDGVPVSTIFYLKSKGKRRGYNEKVETVNTNLNVDAGTVDLSKLSDSEIEALSGITEKIQPEADTKSN